MAASHREWTRDSFALAAFLEPQLEIERIYNLLTGEVFIHDKLLGYLIRKYNLGPQEAEALLPWEVLKILRHDFREKCLGLAAPPATTKVENASGADGEEEPYLGIRLNERDRTLIRGGASVAFKAPNEWRLVQCLFDRGEQGADKDLIIDVVFHDKKGKPPNEQDVYSLIPRASDRLPSLDLAIQRDKHHGPYVLTALPTKNLKGV